MANVRITLDERRLLEDGTAPLKMSISHKSKTALISLNIKIQPKDFDKLSGRIISKSMKSANVAITNYLALAQREILRLYEDQSLESMSVNDLKRKVMSRLFGEEDEEVMLYSYFQKIIDEYTTNTKRTYEAAFRSLKNAIQDKSIKSFTKDDSRTISAYLLEHYKRNSASLFLTAIHHVFNRAIDDEIITKDPFRKVYIKLEETIKRNLSVAELLSIRDYECDNDNMRFSIDIFMLSFYLIGMNTADLFACDKPIDGRIVYHRCKTNKLYSIKIEPEAQAIIDRYSGTNKLLNLSERFAHKSSFNALITRHLSKIRPYLTMYYARHTWATLAHSIGISKDVISMGLGHSFGASVTNVYINYNSSFVDDANRKLLDYLKNYKTNN